MRTPMLLLPPKMKDNSDVIEAIDMVGMDFLDVTIAKDDHNEDSDSVMHFEARIPVSRRIRMTRIRVSLVSKL